MHHQFMDKDPITCCMIEWLSLVLPDHRRIQALRIVLGHVEMSQPRDYRGRDDQRHAIQDR